MLHQEKPGRTSSEDREHGERQERTKEGDTSVTWHTLDPGDPSLLQRETHSTQCDRGRQKIQQPGRRLFIVLHGCRPTGHNSRCKTPQQASGLKSCRRPGREVLHGMPQLPVPVPRARELTNKLPRQQACPQRRRCVPIKRRDSREVHDRKPTRSWHGRDRRNSTIEWGKVLGKPVPWWARLSPKPSILSPKPYTLNLES